MLEPFVRSEVRPKERSVLVIRGVAIAGDPRPVLPETSVCLLVPKEIVMIGMRIRAVDGELIGRLEPQV